MHPCHDLPLYPRPRGRIWQGLATWVQCSSSVQLTANRDITIYFVNVDAFPDAIFFFVSVYTHQWLHKETRDIT